MTENRPPPTARLRGPWAVRQQNLLPFGRLRGPWGRPAVVNINISSCQWPIQQQNLWRKGGSIFLYLRGGVGAVADRPHRGGGA